MKNLSFSRFLCSILLGVLLVPAAFAQQHLVISQVYGGGGNSAAPYKSDFIELYNPTASAVDLTGWSVQYASASGTSWTNLTALSGSIPAGGYFLVQENTGTTGSDLPTPDLTGGTINLSATAGKVALVSSTTALANAGAGTGSLSGTTCPESTNVVDFVGFGTTATCYEGTGPTPAPSNATSVIRDSNNTDTNSNNTDFTALAPNPRNSGSGGQPVPTLSIHEIQGSKSLTTISISPYAGQSVQTSGIVTAVGSAGFFIQSKDSDADADPSTPEGIYVYTGSGHVPASAVIGNELQVTGLVSTYPAASASHTPASEITSPSVTPLSTGNSLPTAVVIDAAKLTPDGGLYQLTPYEGMRVSIASLTVVAPTDGSLTEGTETQNTNGRFYAVLTGTPRPFREPGIDIRDTLPSGAPANIARFDDNPERILVDSTFLNGGTAIDVSTGALLTNVTGVLDFTYSSDSYYDPSRLLLDATYDRGTISAGMSVQAVPIPGDKQFTVAAFNVERFFNTKSADDICYDPVTSSTDKTSAVDITADAYARRLQKLSLAIRNVLNFPDIISLEEVENQGVAADIAAQISADAQAAGQEDPQYVAYGTGTDYAPYTNDIGGISIGFLVKPSRVNTVSVTQYGAATLMTDPRDGTTQQTLNDRPPLVLRAGIKREGATDYPVTVISNHLRSLSSIDDSSSGVFVRVKKELQAEFLAKMIQSFQLAGEHVISVGDYNVFEFSDGFTDVMATVTGQTPLPSNQVVQPALAGLVSPVATDLVTLLPADQRWSYSEDGNAQVLDHIVATSGSFSSGAYVTYAHSDADFPVVMYNDATTPARVSDHDPAVGYFAIPDPVLSATLAPSTLDFGSVAVSNSSTPQSFTVTNNGEANLTVTSIAVGGNYSQTNDCGSLIAVGTSCTVNVVFTPTSSGSQNGTLTVQLGSGTYTSTLTGTTVAPDFTIGGVGGVTSLTVSQGNSGSLSLKFTPENGFTGTITISCTPAGTAPEGVTCTTPAPFTMDGATDVTKVITFQTTPKYLSAARTPHSRLPWQGTLAFAIVGVVFGSRSRKLRMQLLLLGIVVIMFFAVGCGSDGQKTNSNATAPGTYTYTVTAASGTVSRSQTVTLTVQ